MTTSPLGFRSARCARRLRAVGWDLMRVRDEGLEDVWIGSVDLWWWCARVTFRGDPPFQFLYRLAARAEAESGRSTP